MQKLRPEKLIRRHRQHDSRNHTRISQWTIKHVLPDSQSALSPVQVLHALSALGILVQLQCSGATHLCPLSIFINTDHRLGAFLLPSDVSSAITWSSWSIRSLTTAPCLSSSSPRLERSCILLTPTGRPYKI